MSKFESWFSKIVLKTNTLTSKKKELILIMPNFICEELVYKDGKVDIVEQEFSKLWNDKIQRLEAENKKLKEENEKLKKDQLKEIKIMKNKCLKSVSKLSKKIKELQEQVEQLEEDADLDDNEELEQAEQPEVDRVDCCCECNKKRECHSDLFVTIDETPTGGEYYVMCGMCSLTHFKTKSKPTSVNIPDVDCDVIVNPWG